MYDDSPENTLGHSACEDTAAFAAMAASPEVCHG